MNRYLPVNIYRTTAYGDCSLGGVTCVDNDLVVPCPDGHLTEEDVARHGYIKLEVGEAGGVMHFRPEGETGWTMAGGNFVYTPDSRFSRLYGNRPVSVHDRVED